MTGEISWLSRRSKAVVRDTSDRSGSFSSRSSDKFGGRASSVAREVPLEVSEAGRGTLLVVEDEFDIQELLGHTLERNGYHVVTVDRGEDAIRALETVRPDLILLDLMLPGIDGMEVCRRIKSNRETATIPIIMTTARTEEVDMVAGLEIGADDYVTKPFTSRTLLARIKAVMRRHTLERDTASDEDGSALAATGGDDRPVHVGPLSIRPDRHEVHLDGESIELTATEFRLLTLLARKPGRVFSRQQIISSIHGANAAVTDRSVDVQVLHLRRKMNSRGDLIEAIRGVGYRFKD